MWYIDSPSVLPSPPPASPYGKEGDDRRQGELADAGSTLDPPLDEDAKNVSTTDKVNESHGPICEEGPHMAEASVDIGELEEEQAKAGSKIDPGNVDGGGAPRARSTSPSLPGVPQHQLTFKEWLKMSPVYKDVKTALNDIDYVKLSTPSYKNCCLLYSYLMCSNPSHDHCKYVAQDQ